MVVVESYAMLICIYIYVYQYIFYRFTYTYINGWHVRAFIPAPNMCEHGTGQDFKALWVWKQKEVQCPR